MKGNCGTFVFIFSAMLNIAFIGSTAWYRLPPFSASSRPPMGCGLLYEQLALTSGQLDELRSLRERLHGRMSRIGSDIRRRQDQLVDLLSQPSPCDEDIAAAKEEIRGLQGLLLVMLTNHFVENRAVMTPEQYSRFLGLLKEKIRTNCSACPPSSVKRREHE
jgi:hypothetical protein